MYRKDDLKTEVLGFIILITVIIFTTFFFMSASKGKGLGFIRDFGATLFIIFKKLPFKLVLIPFFIVLIKNILSMFIRDYDDDYVELDKIFPYDNDHDDYEEEELLNDYKRLYPDPELNDDEEEFFKHNYEKCDVKTVGKRDILVKSSEDEYDEYFEDFYEDDYEEYIPIPKKIRSEHVKKQIKEKPYTNETQNDKDEEKSFEQRMKDRGVTRW